jgi:peptidoglycan/LPS O-acetylase OafA/YrhL
MSGAAVIAIRSKTGVQKEVAGWLDLARGAAAVEVVAFHAYQLMYIERLPDESHGAGIGLLFSALWTVSSHGAAAVMVFFVLSGYLVGGPAIVRAWAGRLDVVDYFSARMARLYVVLIPALTIAFCAYVSAKQSSGWGAFVASHQDLYDRARILFAPVGPYGAICNGLFLQTIVCSEFAANLPLWSLSNEFWYYVLIFALLSTVRKPAFALAVVGIFGLFLLAEYNDRGGTHTGLRLSFYFAIWSLGALAYAVTMPIVRWTVLVTGSLILLYIAEIFGLAPRWAVTEFTIGLGTAAAIIGLSHFQVSLPSFLNFGKTLAKFSFSLYAIHYPILLFLHVMIGGRYEFTLASFVLNISFVLVCVLAGYVFYLLFERHTPVVRAWLKGVLTSRRSQASRAVDGADR